MFKKFLCLFLTACILISFVGCGKGDTAATTVNAGAKKITITPDESKVAAETLKAAESFAGGTGTKEDPYQVATAEQLQLLSDLCSADDYSSDSRISAYYVLTSDIELNDLSSFDTWTETAPKYAWNPINNFRGSFDGQNHTVTGLYIYNTKHVESGLEDSIGLFGNIGGTGNCEIKNITIDKSVIISIGGDDGIGGIVGNVSYATVSGCISKATIILGNESESDMAYFSNCGGVAGWSYETDIKDCDFSGNIIIDSSLYKSGHLGGLCGYFSDGNAENLASGGTISATKKFSETTTLNVGGIFGSGSFSPAGYTVNNCENSTEINIGSGELGGIFGTVSAGILTDSVDKNTETETATAPSELKNLVNKADINTGDGYNIKNGYVGGIIGYFSNGNGASTEINITDCINEGNLYSKERVGGIVGQHDVADAKTSIKNCTNKGTVTGDNSVGGIAGYVSTSKENKIIDSCTNEGNVVAASAPAGGIVGWYFSSVTLVTDNQAKPLSVKNCVNNGNVSGEGITGIGGVIGAVNMSVAGESMSVSDCTNNGSVSFENSGRAGGILGASSITATNSSNFKIESCINNGSIQQGNGKTNVSTSYEPADNDTESEMLDGAEILISGGSSMGGIVGYLAYGYIKNCENNGDILVGDNTVAVCSADDLQNYMHISEDDDSTYICCGNIFGLSLQNDDYTTDTFGVYDCKYKDSKISYGVIFPETEENMKFYSNIKMK